MTPRNHPVVQRGDISVAHSPPKLVTPPHDLFGATGIFTIHHLYHFRAGQGRAELFSKVSGGFRVCQHKARLGAVGPHQPFGPRGCQEGIIGQQPVNQHLNPIHRKIATGQRNACGPVRCDMVEKGTNLDYCALCEATVSGYFTVKDYRLTSVASFGGM